MTWLWVMAGSAIGGVLRYWLSGLASTHISETFPIGTMIINVTGSFVIGFFAALTGPDGRVFAGSDTRQFVMTGICGGYTTFSSFSLQTLNLANDGEFAWRASMSLGRSSCASSPCGSASSRRRRSTSSREPDDEGAKRGDAAAHFHRRERPVRGTAPLRSDRAGGARDRVLPARPCCADRWASVNRAACTRPRSCSSRRICR